MLTLRRAPAGGPARAWADWKSPQDIPWPWLTTLFAGFAGFSVAVTLVTSNPLHRLWGVFAACAYLLAAMAVLAWKSRGTDLALAGSLAGALAVPLALMAANRMRQPEVGVIDQSAWLLVHHGTPYLSPAVLAAAKDQNLFDPYLPLMTVFGLPRAVAGFAVLTDPRVWFGAVFIAVFGASLAVCGVGRGAGAGVAPRWGRDRGQRPRGVAAGAARWAGVARWPGLGRWVQVARWTGLVTVSPVIAFPLTVGGTDIPVLAFLCLGLALLWQRPRPVAAGLALGAAAAMKATAWPAVAVALALAAARDGWRSAARLAGTGLAVFAVLVGPVAVAWPGALAQNTLAFPLGLASVKSDAASPMPGHLLAETGPAGRAVALVLLVLAGLAVASWLVLRPPRTVPDATWRLVAGLSAMFVLAPATRFGYFVYPAGLLAWLGICLPAAGSPRLPAARLTARPGRPVPSGAPGAPGPQRRTRRARSP
jgi:hypothetical protein